MSKWKKFWLKFGDMFGITKSNKYISDYLHEANMRSGVFMAAVKPSCNLANIRRKKKLSYICVFENY